MLSSIQVIEHVFTEVSVRAHEDFSKEAKHQARFAVRATKEEVASERVWRVDMTYQFGSPDKSQLPSYEGRLKLRGHFLIHPDFPDEKCEYLARMNGGAVLMGAIRELVLNQTQRSINGPLELPLIDARAFLPKGLQDKPIIPSPSSKEESI